MILKMSDKILLRKYFFLPLLLLLSISACSFFRGKPHPSVDSNRLVSLSKAGSLVGHLIWPVKGAHVSSLFGPRRSAFHEGIDLPAPEGTAIYAAHGGEVVYRSDRINGYGKMVVIRTTGLLTVYGHLSEYHVHLGDNIKAGDLIAYVGATGEATAPHLHFETRIKDAHGKNIAVDPLVFYRTGKRS